MGEIDYSLVIPAYNEAALLPRLLDSVDVARAACRGGSAAVEVIVADNGSTDATATIARERGCRVAPVAQRCIAAARNGGARIASGQVLCFIDADSRVHRDTFDAIGEALAGGRVIAGATGVRPERWSIGIGSTFVLMVPMLWLTGIDTGVVFVRRADFDAIGGYDESMRIAEDVDFLWRLKRVGWRRGQRLARVTRAKAVASMRKFDRYGDWHYLTQLPRVAWQSFRQRDVESEFVRRYWYEDR